MSKLTAEQSRKKRKSQEFNRKNFCISDAAAKIGLMLMGIMATVLTFTECFKIECSKGIIVLFTMAILVILSAIMEFKRQNIMLLILAALVLTGTVFLRNYLKVGILSLANTVLRQYQQYYDNVHAYTFHIDTEGLRWSGMYWYNTIVICTIIIEYAYILMTATWNKIYAAVHYMFVMVLVAIPMAFGLFPPAYVVILLMIYCILCLAFRHDRQISVKRGAFIAGLTVLSAGIMFACVNPKTYVEKSRFKKLKDIINTVINEFDIDTIFTNGIFGSRSSESIATGGLGRGQLGKADRISYQGETMLNVTLPLPERDIYLKGYAANYYCGDHWSNSYYSDEYSRFLNLYYEYQTDSMGRAFENIKGAAADIMSQPYHIIQTFCDKKYMISIKNLSGDNNYYVPYNALLTNRNILQDLMVVGYNLSYNVDVLLYDFYDFTIQDYKDLFFGRYQMFENDSMEQKFMEYKEYAEDTCLTVPDYLVQLFSELLPDAPHYDGKSVESLLECVDYAKAYLHENTKYTLSPGRSEEDDFVTDFLLNKKKGYCTSYATTTVLMLRYMGVPARYAEGYRIGYNEIAAGTYNKDTNEYSVNVKDSAAHAWTEVFVYGIGFMTVDTTPASDSDTAGNPTETPAHVTAAEDESETTQPGESREHNETTTAKETNREPDSTSEGESSKPVSEGNSSSASVSISRVIVWIFLLTIGIVVLSACVYIYMDKKKSGNKNINDSIRRLSPERQRMILQSEQFFQWLEGYGLFYPWEKYSGEYAAELEELLKKAVQSKREQLAKENGLEEDLPESEADLTALQFLHLYQEAKYSDENNKISEEDCKKVVHYVDKCKNSLQYLKK